MLFRRAPQKVEELKIVIVGAGEVGFHIAQRLSEEQKQVVVIDQNPDKLRRIEDIKRCCSNISTYLYLPVEPTLP